VTRYILVVKITLKKQQQQTAALIREKQFLKYFHLDGEVGLTALKKQNIP